MNVELSQEELSVVVQALDTHLRQHGIQVAVSVAALVQKLQQAKDD